MYYLSVPLPLCHPLFSLSLSDSATMCLQRSHNFHMPGRSLLPLWDPGRSRSSIFLSPLTCFKIQTSKKNLLLIVFTKFLIKNVLPIFDIQTKNDPRYLIKSLHKKANKMNKQIVSQRCFWSGSNTLYTKNISKICINLFKTNQALSKFQTHMVKQFTRTQIHKDIKICIKIPSFILLKFWNLPDSDINKGDRSEAFP